MSILTDRGAPATIARMDEIERLLAERRAAGISNSYIRISRELRNLQDAELHHFGRALGLRPYVLNVSCRNWNVLCLRDGPIWCELCGFACERQDEAHGRNFPHCDGFTKLTGPRSLSTVVVHSRWSFAHVEAYALSLRLSARLVGWSWMGPEFRAALVTLGDVS